MAKIDRPEAARRVARAIASDLSIYDYNKKNIPKGIQDDNLFELLADEIQKGREYYEDHVSEGTRQSTNFYDRAIVDILFRATANIESKIW